MTISYVQQSLTGGEVTPELFAKFSDAKYQTGLKTCENFIVRPQGPAENRPGTQFVREVRYSDKATRLIPFNFNINQTLVIEVGDLYFRFHTEGATLLSGGTPYQVVSPYLEADLFDLHFVQSADVITITHENYPPAELRRTGATAWTYAVIDFDPPLTAVVGVTAVASGHTTADKYDYEYVVTAFDADQIRESVASASATDAGNLLDTGGIVTISWTAKAGASKYRVYKQQGGIFGYIGETDATSLVDDNIGPDLSIVPPEYETVFASTNNYPRTASYFEQRRTFAGTITEPQKIWMTKSGTESAMSYSLPVRDDDRIKFQVASREANPILHVVPMDQLLLLTSSAEWRVTSVNSDAITPATISVRQQSVNGASLVQPVIVNNSVVYCASRGGRVRELGYSFEVGGYITGDLGLRSTHLFDGQEIVQLAYSQAPDPIIWAVSDSGLLLGVTYVPEQKVGAWHKHSTYNGTFESVCSVAEGVEDHVYVVVKRTINGSTVRYIERMADRIYTREEDAFFVDSGLSLDARATVTTSGDQVRLTGDISDHEVTVNLQCDAAIFDTGTDNDLGDQIIIYDGEEEYRCEVIAVVNTTNATVLCDKAIPAGFSAYQTEWAFARRDLGGLDHLEGETLNIMSDGAEHPQKTVVGGSITLDRPGVVVHAGLPITAELETLPMAFNYDDGSFAIGRRKKPTKAWIHVYRSKGLFAGPGTNPELLREYKQRKEETYGSAVDEFTGLVELPIKGKWDEQQTILIRQSAPLPASILGFTIEMSVG